MITEKEFRQIIQLNVRRRQRSHITKNLIRGRVVCKFYMEALKDVMEIHPDLTNQIVEQYIRNLTTAFKQLNDVLEYLPNAINRIRNEEVENLFDEFYENKKHVVASRRMNIL